MSDAAADLQAWLFEPPTAKLEPPALLDGLAARLGAAGVALHRVSIWIPTKHPELWGHQLAWDPAEGARVLRRSHDDSSTRDYVGTPAEALHRSGSGALRCRLDREPERSRFAMLAAMADSGATDYFMASLEQGAEDGAWVSFASSAPGGFVERELDLLGPHASAGPARAALRRGFRDALAARGLPGIQRDAPGAPRRVPSRDRQRARLRALVLRHARLHLARRPPARARGGRPARPVLRARRSAPRGPGRGDPEVHR